MPIFYTALPILLAAFVLAVLVVAGTLWLRLARAKRKLAAAGAQLQAQTEAAAKERDRYRAELRTASSTLLQLKREQETFELSKKRFLELASHELRTPLMSLCSGIEILGGELGSNPVTDEWLSMLAISAARLTRTVERIEEMVKLDTGFLRSTFQVVGVAEIFMGLRSPVSKMLLNRSVGCVFEWPGLRIGVAAAREQLIRLLELLVENAVDYSPDGKTVAVRSSVILDPTGDDRVLFEVIDEGTGIADEDMKRIFDSFHQIHCKTNGKPDGLGLGLSICRSLATSFGSEISVRRRSGQGSTFSFSIPAFYRHSGDRAKVPLTPNEVWGVAAREPLGVG